MTRQLEVPVGAASERLDLFLARTLDITRSRAQRLIRTNLVQVAGFIPKNGYLVQSSDLITISDPPPAKSTGLHVELPVVYEDADLLVVDKPAGLVVHHGSGTQGLPTVTDFAREHSLDPDRDRPGIVHRLDQDTSGLLIIAKTEKSKSFLQRQFAGRNVQKTYLALLVGRIKPADALIRLPLDRDRIRPTRRTVSPTGRAAETRYHTLANFDGYTLVEAKPLTGRTHQIRVHFAGVGHPVAGDIVYGPHKRSLGLTRQFLHAARLEFTGPSGQHVTAQSPLPADLDGVLTTLGGSGIISG